MLTVVAVYTREGGGRPLLPYTDSELGGVPPVSKNPVWATTGSVGCWVAGSYCGCSWFLRGGLGLVSAARTPEIHYFGQRRDSGREKEWTNLEFFLNHIVT